MELFAPLRDFLLGFGTLGSLAWMLGRSFRW
jgi:hypothetical protein